MIKAGMILMISFLVYGSIPVPGVSGETQLTAEAATPFLNEMNSSDGGGTIYPIGRRRLPIGATEFDCGLSALENFGIIRVEKTGQEGFFNITVNEPKRDEIKVKPDLGGEGVFVKAYDYSSAKVQFNRIEYVKGGKTGWQGAIAYVTLHNVTLRPVAKKIDEFCRKINRRDSDQQYSPQYRLLFRKNPFNDQWRYADSDYYSKDNKEFIGKSVPLALERD